MSSKTMLLLTVCSAAFVVSACGNTKVGVGRGNSGSNVTAVSIGLPDRNTLKSQVPDIETKMNAYRLIVKPVGGNCISPTSIDTVDVYSANPKISASLQQGCDYELTLELGNRATSNSSGSGGSEKVSYEGKVAQYLKDKCAACHAAGQSAVSDLTSWSSVKDRTSEIYDRVVVKGDMPKGTPASDSEKAMLAAWKDGGYLEKSGSNGLNSGTGANSLASVYYRNNTTRQITKEEIQGKSSYSAGVKVQLQQAGRDIGLGTSTIQQPDSGGSTPDTKPFQLTGDRNIALVDATGNEVALNDLIKGKTLILDFSSDTCTYCKDVARKLNSDTALQAKFDDKKCTIVTVTYNANDLADWNRRFEGTYAVKHSYGIKNGSGSIMMDKINNAFGTRSRGTPTFMAISSDGVVDESRWSNTLDNKILSACQ